MLVYMFQIGFVLSGLGLPDSAGLEVGRGSGENSRGKRVTRLAAIHHTLGDRGEISRLILLAKGLHRWWKARKRTRCRDQWWHRNRAGDGSLPQQGPPC